MEKQFTIWVQKPGEEENQKRLGKYGRLQTINAASTQSHTPGASQDFKFGFQLNSSRKDI